MKPHHSENSLPTSEANIPYCDLLYPKAVHLSEQHRRLEGFTALTQTSSPDAPVLTTADVIGRRPLSGTRSVTADPGQKADQEDDSSLSDVLVTISVMLITLLFSGAALGLSASRITIMLKQISAHASQPMVENVGTPSAWRF